jgi:hypothetical protein
MNLSGYLPPVGYATNCVVSSYHSPKPIRYVWHHILPQVCGGKTEATNLVSLCDSCHYAVHALLHDLKVNGRFTIALSLRNRKRAAIALSGYNQAVLAGTANLIPNEGE